MSLALTASVLFGLGVGAIAGEETVAVRPALWDFGCLPQKSEVSHRFYLINTGTAPLTVSKIKAGCSCTTVSQIEDPIAPGDSAGIVVTFKSGRYHHQVKKTTKVYVNDSEEQAYKLTITANVMKKGEHPDALRVTPQKLEWKTIDGAVAIDTDTILVFNRGGDSLAVDVLHVPDSIIVDIEHPRFIAGGDEAGLFVRVSEEPALDKSGGLSITFGFVGRYTTVVTVPIVIDK